MLVSDQPTVRARLSSLLRRAGNLRGRLRIYVQTSLPYLWLDDLPCS